MNAKPPPSQCTPSDPADLPIPQGSKWSKHVIQYLTNLNVRQIVIVLIPSTLALRQRDRTVDLQFNLDDQAPGNHNLRDEPSVGVLVRAETVLVRRDEQDVQRFIRTCERAQENTAVPYGYAYRLAQHDLQPLARHNGRSARQSEGRSGGSDEEAKGPRASPTVTFFFSVVPSSLGMLSPLLIRRTPLIRPSNILQTSRRSFTRCSSLRSTQATAVVPGRRHDRHRQRMADHVLAGTKLYCTDHANQPSSSATDILKRTMDPTSQANFRDVYTDHVALDWTVDFAQKIIAGSATHTLKIANDGVEEVIFDTQDLTIESAQVGGQKADFSLGEKHPVMGSPLRVVLPQNLSPKPGSTIEVAINYKTSPDSPALQWLAKEATQGKTFPYLFSQCQPIYARAVAPLQDSPSVKITYSATVRSTLPVLMSARRVSPPSDGPPHDGKEIGKDICEYRYSQPVAIPSYLLAIAVGNVRYRPLPKPDGKEWSTGIWAEPQLLDAAYWEFSEDTARYLAKEEDVVVPYRFGVYDLLVLPPSFPYGGMENACLTFLTPTLLTGDRTLVDVVVHEATHSWFGNGVTHANATHFWLNEGWTTYIERVLQEKLHSPAHRGFSYIIGKRSLQDALGEYKNRSKYQRLIIDFEPGEDPDDAYSVIPYEKGSNFILHLERTLGGLDAFLPYVREYVQTFMGKSITTQQWKEHLYAYWTKHDSSKVKALDSVDWDGWFFGEGMDLPVNMEYDTTLAQQAYDLAERWDAARSKDVASAGFKESDMDGFDSNQKVVFLERLETYPALPASHISHLGSLYGVAMTANAEVRLRWYALALSDKKSESAARYALDAAKWVVGDDGTGVIKGRMKFCRPVMRGVRQVDEELARKTFEAHKDAFHPIARRLIEKDLGLA